MPGLTLSERALQTASSTAYEAAYELIARKTKSSKKKGKGKKIKIKGGSLAGIIIAIVIVLIIIALIIWWQRRRALKNKERKAIKGPDEGHPMV